MPKAGLPLVEEKDSYITHLSSSKNPFTSKIVLQLLWYWFLSCRDLIVTPLQENTLGAKRQKACLNQLGGSFSRVELTYGCWAEREKYPACFWSVWVIVFVLPYGTTPLCPYFKSLFFFFRPSIVIKSRGEIRVWKFNYLHMLRTKTSILDVPIFITWTHLGCLFLLLHQIIAVDIHTENATSSRQEVCDMVTVPICGNSNWQRNTHYNSLKIASNI